MVSLTPFGLYLHGNTGQHSAFIIAGSLDNPTKSRWATCTRTALLFAGSLALCCGVGGFVGFQEDTQGNILNSLDHNSLPANIARGLLGSTMLFVYPMVRLQSFHAAMRNEMFREKV